MTWDYAFFEYYLSAALLICAMFGMGTMLTPREFLDVARAPRAVLLVVAMQVLVTPLLAIGLSKLFSLPPGIAVGLLVMAAMPGGLFSNILTFIGRGNVALSVSATSVCTLGCLVTTAFVLKTFGETQLPENFSMPVGRILSDIVLCLLLPLCFGMLARRQLRKGYRAVGKLFIRASLVLLVVVILGGLYSGRLEMTDYTWRPPVALIVFGIVSMMLCYGLGYLARLTVADSFTAAIEVVVRNAHLGLLLKAAIFPARTGEHDPIGDGVLYVIVFYGGASLFIAGFEVFARRMKWGVHADKFAITGNAQRDSRRLRRGLSHVQRDLT